MNAKSHLLTAACQRPAKLYRYSQAQWLERSLQLGEFRLCPTATDGNALLPFSKSPPNAYLTLSLASAWDEHLFTAFDNVDACLIVHDTDEFGERIHRAAQRLLPSWAGIDAAVSYGAASPLGAAFTKVPQQAAEQEWLFAWRPARPALSCHPVVLTIGSIEDIAELRLRGA